MAKWHEDLQEMTYNFERIAAEKNLSPPEQRDLQRGIRNLKSAYKYLNRLYPEGDNADDTD